MSTSTLAPIAGASQTMVDSQRQALARGRSERRRRQLVRLIDLAIAQCEQVNLSVAPEDSGLRPRARLSAPPLAAAIVKWLQEAAGEPRRPPATNQEALDELFRLQDAYLLAAPVDLDESGEEAS